MKIKLTRAEKEELEIRHRRERGKLVGDRVKFVLLNAEGWSVAKVAQALRLYQDTVMRYVLDYRKTRRLEPNHKGSQGKLTDSQAETLKAHVCKRISTENFSFFPDNCSKYSSPTGV